MRSRAVVVVVPQIPSVAGTVGSGHRPARRRLTAAGPSRTHRALAALSRLWVDHRHGERLLLGGEAATVGLGLGQAACPGCRP